MTLNNKFKQSFSTINTLAFHMITSREIILDKQNQPATDVLKYILSTFVYIELLPALKGKDQDILEEKLQQLQTFFLLTSLNVNVDIMRNQMETNTLLQIAISEKSDVLFEYLLDNLGADINACNSEGVYPIETAIEKENNHYVEKLIERGSKIDFITSIYDYKSSLCLLLCQDHPFTEENHFLALFLILNGASINPPNSYKVDQPLHLALGKGCFEMVQLLISQGADIRAVSLSGYSPLMLAITANHTQDQEEIISFLIKHEADFCHINDDGNLLHFFNMLYQVSFENIDGLIKQAVQKGVDINHKNAIEGKTPLHCAAANGNIRLMKALIKNGAQINIEDNKKNSAIDLLFSVPKRTVAMMQKEFFENQRAELFYEIKAVLFPTFLPTYIKKGFSEEKAYQSYDELMTESETVQFLLKLNFQSEDIAEYSQFLLFFEKYQTDPMIASQCWDFVQKKPEAAFSVKFKTLVAEITGLSDEAISQKLFEIYVEAEELSLEPFTDDNNKTRFFKLLDIARELKNIDLATNLLEKQLKYLSHREVEDVKTLLVENPETEFQSQLNQLIQITFDFEQSQAYRTGLQISRSLTQLFTPHKNNELLASKLALILSRSEKKQNSILRFFEQPQIKSKLNAFDDDMTLSAKV